MTLGGTAPTPTMPGRRSKSEAEEDLLSRPLPQSKSESLTLAGPRDLRLLNESEIASLMNLKRLGLISGLVEQTHFPGIVNVPGTSGAASETQRGVSRVTETGEQSVAVTVAIGTAMSGDHAVDAGVIYFLPTLLSAFPMRAWQMADSVLQTLFPKIATATTDETGIAGDAARTTDA